MLAATDKIKFVPDGQDGSTDTLTYVAWDQTTGTHGTTADVSAAGGATAFSVASDTATLSVTAINDAPVATAPSTHYSAAAQSDLNLHNTGLSVSDVDGDNGIETATLSASQGIITIGAGDSGVTDIIGNGSGSVSFSGTVAEIDALLNSGTGTVVYNDNAGSSAATVALTLAIHETAIPAAATSRLPPSHHRRGVLSGGWDPTA